MLNCIHVHPVHHTVQLTYDITMCESVDPGCDVVLVYEVMRSWLHVVTSTSVRTRATVSGRMRHTYIEYIG